MLTLPVVRPSASLAQALQGLPPTHAPPPLPDLTVLSSGTWFAAEKRGGDLVSLILTRLRQQPLAFLRDQRDTLYQCRVEASKSLFLGTVLSGVLLSREDGFVLEVLTIESFQGQARRYSPLRTAHILGQLLSSGCLRLLLPKNLRLETLCLRPWREVPPNRGLWLVSEQRAFAWCQAFEALWDGGKLLLVRQGPHLSPLSEMFPHVCSQRLLSELEALKPSSRVLRLAIENNELRVLDVLLLRREPEPFLKKPITLEELQDFQGKAGLSRS
jgi:hypothetical protein